ncbi:ataxin-7-like protein 1 isoform X2 [Callorhinchus milii]|uniref:ataxin-7-like protein 1 isoform X2 n=1 Tax=Callorhinchus milii TaxID=7868 RepID=UPI001C3FCE74|nr:ataxin-7-like protein 1 isoform X2 [Callorhinchus milii]
MAAPERRLPSPEAFVGQSWSNWIERAEALRLGDGLESEDCGKDGRKKIETVRLIREERRHGPWNKLSARKPPASHFTSSTVLQKSRSSVTQPAVTLPRASKEKVQQQSSANKTTQSDVPSKGPKENLCLFVPVVNLEKIPSLGKPDGSCIKLNSKPSASSPSSPLPPMAAPGGKAGSAARPGVAASIKPAPTPPSAPATQNGQGDLSPVLEERMLNNRKNSHKVYRRVLEKECELDKHCGVMDPETKKPCTRSLTCKTHSLTQRRKVLGRRLEFDELLAEHRANTRSKEAAKAGKQQPREPATPAQTQEMAATDSGQPLRESPSTAKSHSCPASRFTSACDVTGVGSAQDEPELETPFPLFRFELDTRISSEESEGETAEEAEKLGCRYSRLHPKPIAFCTFGSRMVGRGCYAFDRRLNHLRSALNSMVERHLNSQMWRKIPPASDCQAVPLSVPAPSAAFLCPQSLSASVSCLPATASSCCPSAVSAQTKPASPSLADPSRTSTTTCALSDPSPLSPPPPVLPPSPPFSKMPSAKSSKSSRLKESPQPGKRKKNAAASVPEPSPKRNCVLGTSRPGSASCAGSSDRSPQRNTPPHKANNGIAPHGNKAGRSGQSGIQGHSGNCVKGTARTADRDSRQAEGRRLLVPSLAATLSLAKAEGRKRKNTASYSKPPKIAKAPELSFVQRKREEQILTATRAQNNTHSHKAKMRP